MMNARVAIILAVLLCDHVQSGAAEEHGNRSGLSDSAPPSIKSIRAVWKSRSSNLCSGELRWRLASRARSATYGGLQLIEDGERDALTSEFVTVLITPRTLQFEGKCQPSIRFDKNSLPGSGGSATDRKFFEALNSQFDGVRIQGPQHEAYTVHLDSESETHSWTKQSTGARCVVVFPPGTAGSLLFYDSTCAGDLPLIYGLIEAMRLALWPEYRLDPRLFAADPRILPARPVVEGHNCRVIEYEFKQPRGNGICQLWVDPSRDYIVVRAIFLNAKASVLAQYDFDYDRDELNRWLPLSVTVMQINSYGDCYDQVRASRDTVRMETKDLPKQPQVNPPIGTWVIDLAADEQYRIGEGGAKIPLAWKTAMAEITDQPDLSMTASTEPMLQSTWSRFLFRIIAWPLILVTLPTLYTSWIAARAVTRRLRSRIGRSPEAM